MSEVILASPLGALRLCGDDGGLRAIEFLGEPRAAPHVEGGPPVRWREAERQLRAYFAGELRAFRLPLAPRGTPFQRAVWERLLELRYGETLSYGELALRVGRPGAARAVGAAVGRNPLPIVIPCHRVVGADGRMTGYAGGLPAKRRLLALERSGPLGC